tara:strand:+ start:248 stop:577 length:330 start_codon:yes stop_codon:yes gene_type:complete
VEKYPKYIKDILGRVYITKISNDKTIIKKYWGSSRKIKIFYVLNGDIDNPKEINIDIIDKKGNIILNYSNFFGLKIKIYGFLGFNRKLNDNIRFPVKKVKILNWIKKNK